MISISLYKYKYITILSQLWLAYEKVILFLTVSWQYMWVPILQKSMLLSGSPFRNVWDSQRKLTSSKIHCCSRVLMVGLCPNITDLQVFSLLMQLAPSEKSIEIWKSNVFKNQTWSSLPLFSFLKLWLAITLRGKDKMC